MKRRTMALVATAATAGVALAGCSSGSGDADASTVSYMTWETTDTNAALDATFAKFTESDGITLDREESPNTDYAQKLASLLLAKKAPDFFWCSTTQAQNLAAEGLLFDWTDYLKDSGKGLDESSFAPGALDLFTASDGKIYGIPTLANTFGFFYNADLFEKAGVPLPTQDWTWDDMLAAAKGVTGVEGTQGPGLVSTWTLLQNPLGASAYSVANGGEPLLDASLGATEATASPELIAGAQKLADAASAGYITDPTFDATSSPSIFSNGGIAMMFGGQWLAQLIDPAGDGFDWGFAPWPTGSDGNVQPIEANGVCSPASLDNPDETYQAIAYMEEDGFNEVMSQIPVAPIAYTPGSTGYFENLEEQGGGFASIAETAKYELAAEDKFVTQLLDPWATKADDVIKASWYPALGGTADLKTGVTETVDGIQSLIDTQQ